MSVSSQQDDVVELVLHLRGLRIAVSGPAREATRLASDIARLPAGSPRRSSSPASSYTLVTSAPEVPVEVPSQPAPSPARFETRASIEATFETCPGRYLDLGARLSGGDITGEDRIRRAWRAGQWAKAVLDRRVGSPNRTGQISIRPRVYVVLQAPGLSSPVAVNSSAEYFRIVGRLHNSDTLSHSFPSETEAKVYCLGAGVPLPPTL